MKRFDVIYYPFLVGLITYVGVSQLITFSSNTVEIITYKLSNSSILFTLISRGVIFLAALIISIYLLNEERIILRVFDEFRPKTFFIIFAAVYVLAEASQLIHTNHVISNIIKIKPAEEYIFSTYANVISSTFTIIFIAVLVIFLFKKRENDSNHNKK